MINKIKYLLLGITLLLITAMPGISGNDFDIPVTDAADESLFGFFDLRERETYIQVTNVAATNNNVHIQIFDVSNNCNENNFFDLYTPSDTHVYNLRDIITNDGNDSGVILPDGAYGVFVALGEGSGFDFDAEMMGNLRILDNTGYEYRTNLQGEENDQSGGDLDDFATFNFNTESGVTLSDIIGIPFDDDGPQDDLEVLIANVLDVWVNLDVNIYDLNENVFSCRNVVFACVNENHPQLEQLLEEVSDEGGSSSVASFEYGINEAIPHSKGGELLCPGNQISDGFVRLEYLEDGGDTDSDGIYFIGLNNGNGRGSMDSMWFQNVGQIELPPDTLVIGSPDL